AGHARQSSPGSQTPLPQKTGHGPQSIGHVVQSSCGPHTLSPQPGGQVLQSSGQLAQSSFVSQTPSPQVAAQTPPAGPSVHAFEQQSPSTSHTEREQAQTPPAQVRLKQSSNEVQLSPTSWRQASPLQVTSAGPALSLARSEASQCASA